MSKTVVKKAVHSIKFPGRIIQAGTTFACPVENVAELEAGGAIAAPKALIAAEVGAEAPAPAPVSVEAEAPAPAPAAPAPAPAAPVMSPAAALKAAKAQAESLGIKVRANWKLATILNKIKAVEDNGDIL